MKTPLNIFWYRRDLRLFDNAGLYYSLRAGLPVMPIFIFDTEILDQLENKEDARVSFIYQTLVALNKELQGHGSALRVYVGKPAMVFQMLIEKYPVVSVFTNEDYEPYARERDSAIEKMLAEKSIGFHAYKDQVIFSKAEVLKDNGEPYTIFTPYRNKWMQVMQEKPDFFLSAYPTEKYFQHLYQAQNDPMPSLSDMGFYHSGQSIPPAKPNADLIRKYAEQRDYPGRDATTHLGIHLRFGSMSIRMLTGQAQQLNAVFLNELIWREFYQMILWHFPAVGRGRAFKKSYENIKWRNNAEEFEAWCNGQTGYPIVDAGMRQLNETGFMHNRVRMITASFLSKHLLIDWRWGEAYFAGKLLDFDLASNNGGWQWSAGCGCDAAPYFRVFNPTLQQKKFDPEGIYIKRWLPDFQELDYPQPIVEHGFARQRALAAYREAGV